jgi:hypothetical protein
MNQLMDIRDIFQIRNNTCHLRAGYSANKTNFNLEDWIVNPSIRFIYRCKIIDGSPLDATHWAPTFGERHRYPTIHGLYSHRHVAMCGPEYFGAGILGPGQKKGFASNKKGRRQRII